MEINLMFAIVTMASFVIGAWTERCYHKKWYIRNRIYSNQGWQPISTLPPDERNFLITDGDKVSSDWRPKYDSKGRVTFDLGDKVATHWRRFPPPPKPE